MNLPAQNAYSPRSLIKKLGWGNTTNFLKSRDYLVKPDTTPPFPYIKIAKAFGNHILNLSGIQAILPQPAKMTTSTLQLASIATLLHILVCVQGNLPFIHRDLDIFIGSPTRPLRFLLPEDSCDESTGNARGRECEQPCTSFDVELDSNALSADGRAK